MAKMQQICNGRVSMTVVHCRVATGASAYGLRKGIGSYQLSKVQQDLLVLLELLKLKWQYNMTVMYW